MELRHLRYFLAVAEELHFGVASRRLHIAQSPLSRQIKQLEDDLGVTLFQRTKRRVELTEAGRAFASEARAVLAATEQARRTASLAKSGKIGRLSLGFTNSAIYTIFPKVLLNYQRKFPLVDLVLKINLLTPDQVRALVAKQIDIGLLRPPIESTELELLPISSEPLVVALPRDHQLAARQKIDARSLAKSPFIVFSRSIKSSLSNSVMQVCHGAGFYPKIAYEVTDIPTMVLLISSGVGISLVPASTKDIGVSDVVYRPLTRASPLLTMALAWNPSLASPVRDAFVELAKAMLKRTSPKAGSA